MTDNYDYDVVIVGGGIAGALAGAKLAAEGRSVLILEAGPERVFALIPGFAEWLMQAIQITALAHHPFECG